VYSFHSFFFFPSLHSVLCNYVLYWLVGNFNCLFSLPWFNFCVVTDLVLARLMYSRSLSRQSYPHTPSSRSWVLGISGATELQSLPATFTGYSPSLVLSLAWRCNLAITNSQVQCQTSCLHII
jgi:hypothetical protein